MGRGLMQEELASRARLTAKVISMLERGESKCPCPHTVISLVDALGLSKGERAVFAGAVSGRSRDSPVPVEVVATRSFALPAPLTPLLGRER